MVFRPLAGVGVDVGVGVGLDVGVIAGIGLDFGPGIGERVECPTSQDEAPGYFARSWSGDRRGQRRTPRLRAESGRSSRVRGVTLGTLSRALRQRWLRPPGGRTGRRG
ncbi:hypothetical protein DEJ00_08750 [Curtobacterium sp. MCLR17_039]|nr:hypothetical protein DEJ00_08750 [Curtobacterium sp. MCLR17_039]